MNFERKLLVFAAKIKLKPIKTIRKLFGEKIWKQLTHLPEKSTKILNILNDIFDLGETQKSNKIQKAWEKVIILDYVLQCFHLITLFWFDWHT